MYRMFTLPSPIEQVRRLVAEYCQFLDDRRLDEWTALFAPDGLWVLGEREFRGRAEMRAYMDRLAAERPTWRTRHLCTNVLVELDADRGRVTSDLTMLTKTGDAPWSVTSIGRYADRVERSSDRDRWQFTERRLATW